MKRLLDLETTEMADDFRRQSSSALSDWYARVRELEISNLSDGDLSVACRQGLFLEAIVPLVLSRLAAEPLAGDKYDGDLLASLVAVPQKYWSGNEVSRRELGQVLTAVREAELPSDMAADVAKLEALAAC